MRTSIDPNDRAPTRRRRRHPLAAAVAALVLALTALPAAADHGTNPSEKLHALGHSEHPAQFFGVPAAERTVSSDIAFWGKYAIHGNYDGFRIVDISAPGNPKLVAHPRCNGDQGDIFVWEHIVVRSWNSPAPAGRSCLGEPVPVGFEGVHVFDISDVHDPQLLATVPLPCGSHTVTGVPDLANDRLVVYSNVSSSGAGCPANPTFDAIDIVEVPLGDPASSSRIGEVPLTDGSLGSNLGCHDAGVILGDVNLLACASGHAANVFSIGAPGGGTLEDPEFLYTVEEEERDADGNLVGKVGIGGRWHSAAFTWDGDVLILGWEPGGGAEGRCRADSPDIDKSMFFYDAATGQKLGQWVLPRPQLAEENCTIHNYDIVPLRSGRYVAVSGNYQAGTWVTDFTDPAAPQTVAFSDPPPIVPTNLGGAWSSYWYNGFIYESEIQSGLNVYRTSDEALAGAIRLPYLNPQTQDPDLLTRGG
ncbi:MAG TPA: hypothetical protein VFZ77_04730 [Acidimicrobiales bacterium]